MSLVNKGPSILVANNDSEAIILINQLSGNNYTNISDALQWVSNQSNIYVQNRASTLPLSDGLVFYVDVTNVGSYPKGGSVWYDIAGGNNVTYQYNNGLIIYDSETNSLYRTVTNVQSDFYRSSNVVNLTGSFTMIAMVLVLSCHNGTANGILTNHSHANNTGGGITVKTISTSDFRISCNTGNGTSRTYNTYYGTTNIKDRWSHLVMRYDHNINQITLIVNGEVENTINYSMSFRSDYIDLFNWSTTYYSNPYYKPEIKLQYGMVYNRLLSIDEIKQNYYRGSLVTDQLVLHYDFSNLSCYDTSGSLVYNLSNPAQTATIINNTHNGTARFPKRGALR